MSKYPTEGARAFQSKYPTRRAENYDLPIAREKQAIIPNNSSFPICLSLLLSAHISFDDDLCDI
jgi:hypothetical protein